MTISYAVRHGDFSATVRDDGSVGRLPGVRARQRRATAPTWGLVTGSTRSERFVQRGHGLTGFTPRLRHDAVAQQAVRPHRAGYGGAVCRAAGRAGGSAHADTANPASASIVAASVVVLVLFRSIMICTIRLPGRYGRSKYLPSRAASNVFVMAGRAFVKFFRADFRSVLPWRLLVGSHSHQLGRGTLARQEVLTKTCLAGCLRMNGAGLQRLSDDGDAAPRIAPPRRDAVPRRPCGEMAWRAAMQSCWRMMRVDNNT